jgi:hypothetical protein
MSAESPADSLPPLYAPWLLAAAGGVIPNETVATCDRCVMLPEAGTAPGPHHFLPGVKCCTFQPTLHNFLVGALLADPDPSLAHGLREVEARLERRAGVVPAGILPGPGFRRVYAPGVFGRSPSLKCGYLAEGVRCGVWRHRPGVCATWFCKHVRGEIGHRFWTLADGLLKAVESDLSVWCAAELGAPEPFLGGLEPEDAPGAGDFGGPLDVDRYRRTWGPWAGREREFYGTAADLVKALAWPDVLTRCGPRARVLAGMLADVAREHASDAIPERLRLGSLRLVQDAAGRILVETYSGYDPLSVPPGLLEALRYFDGRPTREALEAIRSDLNLTLGVGLVRRMVDFGILRRAGELSSPS